MKQIKGVAGRLGRVRATTLAQGVGLLAVAVGGAALIGWAIGLPPLTSLRAGWPTLKANTSFAYILLGVGLFVLARSEPFDASRRTDRRLLLSRILGLLAAFIGAVTVCEYLLDWNPGFDRLLFLEAAAAEAGNHPGRMAPDTALSLTLLGAALAISAARVVRGWRTGVTAACALAAGAGGVSSLAVIATPALGMESWLGATGMSVQSSVLITLVGTALLALLLHRTPGIWTLGRGVSAALAVGLTLLVLSGLATSRLQHQLADREAEIVLLERSRGVLSSVLEGARAAQTAIDAYVAFGDRSFLREYDRARSLTDSSVAQLREFAVRNGVTVHRAHLAAIDSLTTAQVQWQDSLLRRPSETLGDPRRRTLVTAGLRLSASRDSVLRIVEREHRAAIVRLQEENQSALDRSYAAISFMTFASVVLFLVALLQLNSTSNRQRAAEAELRESEFRWKFAIEGAGDGLWDWDVRTSKVFFSPRWKSMLGYADDEVGDSLDEWTSRIHPDDRDAVVDALQAHLDGTTTGYESEHRVRCKDGGWKWIRDRGVVVQRDASGEPRRAIGTHSDVTARHEIAQALIESEARYRTLIEMSPDSIAVHQDGRVVYINPATVSMMRASSAADLVGMPVLDLIHPDFRAIVLERLQRIREHGTDAPLIEERFQCLDGSTVDVEVTARSVVFNGQQATLVTCRDITARKAAVAALEASEAQFRTIFDEAPLGIAVVDSVTGKMLDVNRRCTDISGWTREQLLDIDWLRITHPDDVAENLDKVRHLTAGAVPNYRMTKRLLRPDGSAVWIQLTAAPLRSDRDGTPRHIAMVEDITALKREEDTRSRLEAQLQAAQRMESVGRLAGGVAHDFNNMLGVILGTAELTLQQLDPSNPLRADLLDIQGAARRSAELTRQLLSFARRQVVAPAVLDANQVVDGALTMLQRLIGEDIRLEWHPAPTLWPIAIDPTQLDQMMTNLCLNARHAITDVGAITISSDNRTVDAAFCTLHADAVPGDYVCLTVRDTGSGIAPDILEHIFEPFFTTKALGEGTGLGLSTVYGAVRQNHGFITVDSVLGAGATFAVYLPRHVASAPEPRRSGGIEALAVGSETVLVVEDEPSILRMTTRMLTSQGYAVIGTTNPHDAIGVAIERAAEIDLLLTDVVMPGMNGRELATTLAPICPKLTVVFMSGHPADVMARRGVVEGGVNFIQKPFTAATLAAKVREALATAEPDGD